LRKTDLRWQPAMPALRRMSAHLRNPLEPGRAIPVSRENFCKGNGFILTKGKIPEAVLIQNLPGRAYPFGYTCEDGM
jgi:hypothetical protein